jgi:hypothetical protein
MDSTSDVQVKLEQTGEIACSDEKIIQPAVDDSNVDANEGDSLKVQLGTSNCKLDHSEALDGTPAGDDKPSELAYTLPDALFEAPDPASFISNPLIVQPIEEAFFAAALDICSICGSAGSSGFLLFCTGFV